MQNLTNYTDQELSLTVFNVESLYHIRHTGNHLMQVLNDRYTFTDAQLDVLNEDLINDLNEEGCTR